MLRVAITNLAKSLHWYINVYLLAPVVKRLDNTYPLGISLDEKTNLCYQNKPHCPLDNDLSGHRWKVLSTFQTIRPKLHDIHVVIVDNEVYHMIPLYEPNVLHFQSPRLLY